MNLKDMYLGWFVGMFEPSVYKSNDVELGVKRYKKGDFETSHFHKKATEITIIIEGKVSMNGIIYQKDDIILIKPNSSTDFQVLEDTTTVVAKLPANTNDKYLQKTILISHRGNLEQPNEDENNPNKILDVIQQGFQCEIDLWSIKGDLYLGHDEPQYTINLDFISELKNNLWIHAKNVDAFAFLNNLDNSYNYFWHKDDVYTLTSKNFIWGNINSPVINNSICVLPEQSNITDFSKYYGLCSDKILYYKNNLNI